MSLEGNHREEDDSPSYSSAYIQKKDLRNLLIVLLIFSVPAFFFYRYFRSESERAICTANMKAISEAIAIYANQHDDRFPPAYVTGKGTEPALFDGKPLTWGTLISTAMDKRNSLRCPSAHEVEVVHAVTPKSSPKPVDMTYGIYSPIAGFAKDQVADLSGTVLAAETANFGARKTYNPFPLRDPSGKAVEVDGFLIGYNTGNGLDPTSRKLPHGATHVTRLAFYDTASGEFSITKEGRHSKGIRVLYADGSVGWLKAPGAAIETLGDSATGLWSTIGH